MPLQSIVDLRAAIEAAPEMTPDHREQMLALVSSLEKEVASAGGEAALEEEGERAEKLRGAIAVAGEVVRQRAAGEESEAEHDLADRLAELEEKAEMIAVEHPVIANVLAAIARLV